MSSLTGVVAHPVTKRHGKVAATSLYTSQQQHRHVSNEAPDNRLGGVLARRLSGTSSRLHIGK